MADRSPCLLQGKLRAGRASVAIQRRIAIILKHCEQLQAACGDFSSFAFRNPFPGRGGEVSTDDSYSFALQERNMPRNVAVRINDQH
jgi:hypothetical protein